MIQTALDSLESGDTVLVAAGIYEESLQAPAVTFMLLGVVDSSSTPNLPMVDPSTLFDPTRLACLTLPINSYTWIESFIFRNGSEMYPRDHDLPTGGIQNNSAELTLRHCLFDSTFKGIMRPDSVTGRLSVFDCEFRNNVGLGIRDQGSRRVEIHNCSFSGSSPLVMLGDSASVDSCTFDDVIGFGEWMWLGGQVVTVRNCAFGPTLERANAIIYASVPQGCTLENNVFRDLELSAGVVTVYADVGDTTYFRNNTFSNCHGNQALAGGGGLRLNGQDGPMNVVISNCTFDSCTAPHSIGYGAIAAGQATLVMTECQFRGHDITAPEVRFGVSPVSTVHQCAFDRTGWAMYSYSAVIGAQQNWWGDESGPHHSVLNPAGLGDSVAGPVNFIPWLTENPVSSPDHRDVAPSEFVFEVYPNPFNLRANLKFTVPKSDRYKLVLYDLMGRKVRDLWEGAIVFDKEVSFSTENLASGIYLARASEAKSQRQVAITKLILLK